MCDGGVLGTRVSVRDIRSMCGGGVLGALWWCGIRSMCGGGVLGARLVVGY